MYMWDDVYRFIHVCICVYIYVYNVYVYVARSLNSYLKLPLATVPLDLKLVSARSGCPALRVAGGVATVC